MNLISKEDILKLYHIYINDTNGFYGIKNEIELEHIINQTRDDSTYKNIFMKIVKLSYDLIVEKPFIDSNEKFSLFVLLTYLEVNGIEITLKDDEIYSIIENIKLGKISYKDFLKFLEEKK